MSARSRGRGWSTRSWFVPDAADAEEAIRKARLTAPAGWYHRPGSLVRQDSPTPAFPRSWRVQLRRVGR